MSNTQGVAPALQPVEPVSAEQKEFLSEIEVMDLTPIKGKTYIVAVSTGDPNKVKFLCSTIHGPYDFTEMCQEVGEMWVQHQHHAKVIIIEKDQKQKVLLLDANTIDYIEAHYIDIIMEETLASFGEKEFTCVAGTIAEPEPEKKQMDCTVCLRSIKGRKIQGKCESCYQLVAQTAVALTKAELIKRLIALAESKTS